LLKKTFGEYAGLGLFQIEVVIPVILVASGACHDVSREKLHMILIVLFR
jgi:hypothetical protein